MFSWRITKYNPDYRNNQGIYLKDEWTSYHDINRIQINLAPSYEEYLDIEDSYVEAILSFMDCNGIDELVVDLLEKHSAWDIKKDPYILNSMQLICESLHEKSLLKIDQVGIVVRLILRDYLWCRLESQNMYVHFGYDYYMYIGSARKCIKTINNIKKSGLFVEEFESPFTNEALEK